MRADDVLEDGAGDVLGPAFADSALPSGTLSMLSHLKRAREYRRRADRQQECLENEVIYIPRDSVRARAHSQS